MAFTGTIAEFKYRSIIREIGKEFGLPKEELDILSRNPDQLREKNKIIATICEYGAMLRGSPNQRSMHSCPRTLQFLLAEGECFHGGRIIISQLGPLKK